MALILALWEEERRRREKEETEKEETEKGEMEKKEMEKKEMEKTGEEEGGKFHAFLKKNAKKAGLLFLSHHDPVLFSLFLRVTEIRSSTVRNLLEVCNREERTQEAALLLEYTRKHAPGKHSSSLKL